VEEDAVAAEKELRVCRFAMVFSLVAAAVRCNDKGEEEQGADANTAESWYASGDPQVGGLIHGESIIERFCSCEVCCFVDSGRSIWFGEDNRRYHALYAPSRLGQLISR
jgi:hypothetical protein